MSIDFGSTRNMGYQPMSEETVSDLRRRIRNLQMQSQAINLMRRPFPGNPQARGEVTVKLNGGNIIPNFVAYEKLGPLRMDPHLSSSYINNESRTLKETLGFFAKVWGCLFNKKKGDKKG